MEQFDKFYGFDLGDAESAISVLTSREQKVPEVLPVCGSESFITAYARLTDGNLAIGENACYTPDAIERRLRFKSRFLTDPATDRSIKAFAGGVLGQLYAADQLQKSDNACFYIGCPAGWDRNARERYREIFEKAGFPPVRIISESRAALVTACQSKHLQVGYDILTRPVLVVDMGSSTTDFAYICGGREVELQTAGEVRLGGGIMDEILLEESLNAARDGDKIRKIFTQSAPWRSYCEFACRRLKEKYFSDEAYWAENECVQTVTIAYRGHHRLRIRMNADIAEKLTSSSTSLLNGRSFRSVFQDSLREVRSKITGKQPELLFLTGGVSKLPAVRKWCETVFPEAVIICGAEPEFSVSRGLSWCGRIDDDLRAFKKEVDDLVSSSTVEKIVEANLDTLYRSSVDALVEPIIRSAVLPVLDRWRNGEIERLVDIDAALEQEIAAFLRSDETRDLLMKPITTWMKPVAYALEEHTLPICIAHNVPYRALSLNSRMTISDVDIHVDARNVFAMEETSWMINTIVSVLVGLLCGGSGVALISSGLPGIVAGAVVSLLVLFLGKNKMQGAVMKARIPRHLRKVIPAGYFESRMQMLSGRIKSEFYRNLEEEQNEEISRKMVTQISDQIEQCLIRMAEVVEIPLIQ